MRYLLGKLHVSIAAETKKLANGTEVEQLSFTIVSSNNPDMLVIVELSPDNIDEKPAIAVKVVNICGKYRNETLVLPDQTTTQRHLNDEITIFIN